jgi:hypothetical protein
LASLEPLSFLDNVRPSLYGDRVSSDKFYGSGSYIIDDSMVTLLKYKTNSMFILCNANQFVQRHGREGLNCGKFISEEGEAIYYGFDDVEWDLIDQSYRSV